MSLATVSTKFAAQAVPKPRGVDDWYVEPAGAVTALIGKEAFEGGRIWDPCCGGGTIPRTMRAARLDAHGSDIVDRANGEFGVHDFLGWGGGIAPIDHIVMNPPYRDAQAFIEKARGIASRKVAALCRLAFLEGMARRAWFERGLSRVWVFSDRISMPPGAKLASGEVKRGGGAVAFAWFVWDHEHEGPPTLGWINSRRPS